MTQVESLKTRRMGLYIKLIWPTKVRRNNSLKSVKKILFIATKTAKMKEENMNLSN